MTEKYAEMTEQPVHKLICKLAVPTIFSMLVASLYNLADTFYVGRINTQATAAVGVAFALMSIIQAVGFFFGHGSGNFLSRHLGARDVKGAQVMATTGFVYVLAAGCLITVAGELFLDELCVGLGSTPTILPYTRSYVRILLLGAPFMTGSLVMNNQLRYQGNALYSMIGIVTGAVLNVALAPLFIFTFGMGVTGAAAATVLCQAVSFCILLAMIFRRGTVPYHWRSFSRRPAWLLDIVRGGSPSLARQGLACLATLLLNVAAGEHGDAAIAGMSIVTRAVFFIYAIFLGFCQGYQPVCGFNYGAGLYRRVLDGYWFCVRYGFVFLLICAVFGFWQAPAVIALFRHDPEVIAVGTVALRWQLAVFSLNAFATMSNVMLQTIGRSVRATVLASARQGLFFVPLILVLPRCFGLQGVEMCQAVADLLTFALALPLTLGVLRELRAGVKKEPRQGA